MIQCFSYVLLWVKGEGLGPGEMIARNYAPEIRHDLGYYHNDEIDSRYMGYLFCETDNQVLVDRCLLSLSAWDARKLTEKEACALAERMAPPNMEFLDEDEVIRYTGRAVIGKDGRIAQPASDVPVDATPLDVAIIP